jgi:formylglycine-generating enzyme required for sulfatase activity
VGTNGSPSYYGTFDQGGNVIEWNDLTGAAGSSRGVRGGYWGNGGDALSSSVSDIFPPATRSIVVGLVCGRLHCGVWFCVLVVGD